MSLFSDYFGGNIFVITTRKRQDRRDQICRELVRLGINAPIWFDGHTDVLVEGRVSGNAGCVASHRGVMEIIAHQQIERAMILEDDCQCIYNDFDERFERFIRELPSPWGIFYLGGGYAEPPIRRASPHVIQVGRMMTTSSYAVTWQMARKMAPTLCGGGPIDSLIARFNRDAPSYCISPRCMVQRPSYSDLQEREMDNSQSMLDRALEQKMTP